MNLNRPGFRGGSILSRVGTSSKPGTAQLDRMVDPQEFPQVMYLDLRKPTYVLVGAWNPAIFRDAWIAKHVFGVEAGTEIELRILQEHAEPSGEPLRTVRYFGPLGLSFTANRIEFFLDQADKAPELEAACQRLCDTLPHTPLGAIGINFHFDKLDPPPELLDMLATKDELNQHYGIESERHQFAIPLEDAVLNFTWETKGAKCSFSFNYHQTINSSLATLKAKLSGSFEKRLAHAKELLATVYSLNEFHTKTHQQS